MARWNDSVTLVSIQPYQDDEGKWHEDGRREREVFCNQLQIGTLTMAQLRSSEVRITNGESATEVGLRKMALVQVRSLDYDDEPIAIFHDTEMDVIAVTMDGENSKLLMRQRFGNDPVR